MFEKQIKLNKKQKILVDGIKQNMDNAEMLMLEGARQKKIYNKKLWECVRDLFPSLKLDTNGKLNFATGIITYVDVPDVILELKKLKEDAILANDYEGAARYRDQERELSKKLQKEEKKKCQQKNNK